MDGNFRKGADGVDESLPNEAWLFAQAVLGKPIPNPRAAAVNAQADRELLQWVADISPEHAREMRSQVSEEAAASADRALLEWLATISPRHEAELRDLVRAEAEATAAREYATHLSEPSAVQEWDASKHPRGGFPENPGWFSPAGGSGGAADESEKHAGDVPSSTPDSLATKSQLPADDRGTWVSGSKGDGVFRYNDSIENKKAGLAGKEVRFKDQHIAVGGLPAEAYYRGDPTAASVEIDAVLGTNADNLAADAKMREAFGKNWKRPNGYIWNHAGPPGSKVMELVKRPVHEAVSHKGPAAEPRALRRAARASGTTGRAMGALTVYLTARDALQAAGVLQPEYEVAERETYHYVAEGGSVFVVWPGSLLSRSRREFVAGPRKGETETLTKEEVDAYREQAEKEWGKYIPGTLFSQPRFIPGSKRKTLPLIRYRFGVPYEAGWIDEDGVHYYSDQPALIA